MSFFNIPLNCSPKCESWEEILYHYRDDVSDEDIWEYARESKELPVLANVYQNLVLDRVIAHFCDEANVNVEDLDIFVFVNSIDTHLVINDWDIGRVDDYWQCIAQVSKKTKQ